MGKDPEVHQLVHLITTILLLIFLILLVWIFVFSYRMNMHNDSKYHIIEDVDESKPKKEPPSNKHAPAEDVFFDEEEATPLNQLEEGKINIQDVPSLTLDTLVASKGIRLKAHNIDIDTIKSEKVVQLKFNQLTATTLHGGLLFLNFGREFLKNSCLQIAQNQQKSRAIHSGHHKTFNEDMHIPPYSIIETPIVCRKDLIVSEGVIFLETIQVDGSLRAKGHVTFKNPVTVNKNMSVGPYSRTQSYLFVKNKLMIDGPFFFISAKKEEKSFVIGRKVTLKNMIIGSGDIISLDKKAISCYAE